MGRLTTRLIATPFVDITESLAIIAPVAAAKNLKGKKGLDSKESAALRVISSEQSIALMMQRRQKYAIALSTVVPNPLSPPVFIRGFHPRSPIGTSRGTFLSLFFTARLC